MKNSLQFKIGLSYFAIIIAVLVILNTYPLIESQNLVFRSKETLLVLRLSNPLCPACRS